MAETPNGILLRDGHNNGGRCEKCWREAGMRYAGGQGPYESHVDAYCAVLVEAEEAASLEARERPLGEDLVDFGAREIQGWWHIHDRRAGRHNARTEGARSTHRSDVHPRFVGRARLEGVVSPGGRHPMTSERERVAEQGEEIHVGACPTCGGMVQITADEEGAVGYRHIDLRAVWLRRYRAEMIAAVERVGRLDFSPRDLVAEGCFDMGGDSIGSRVAALRRHAGWTQSEVAASAGVSAPYLSEIENDKRDPGAKVLLAIADALGASVDYLVRGPR